MSSSTTLSYTTMIPRKRLFTVAEYQQMGKQGLFTGKERVELIDGEIYTMSPLTSEHNGQVDIISRFFNKKLDDVIVRTQGSIRMDDRSEPEPDIAILKYANHFYRKVQATAQDTIMVIEVAVNTLKHDRTIKKNKYATGKISEYWIVIPLQGIIEVYREPMNDDYAEKKTYDENDSWVIESLNLSVKGSDFL